MANGNRNHSDLRKMLNWESIKRYEHSPLQIHAAWPLVKEEPSASTGESLFGISFLDLFIVCLPLFFPTSDSGNGISLGEGFTLHTLVNQIISSKWVGLKLNELYDKEIEQVKTTVEELQLSH
uniref:Uncharacterized protein n=1 Tax=Utricularia reniformis TaxID=192314 RepID=A0A1Y0AZ33_9LAMI|nr:hypothetical protein AEK19_MT1836 [Utricularia reniformis]ART30410.1 hypothetical protein AEK19_MT1836 [Utricularia reniformis]